jgi:hypothetical protein
MILKIYHTSHVFNTSLIIWTVYDIGNMWAQNWHNLADLVIPFPAKPTVDVSSEMLRQGYTPLR